MRIVILIFTFWLSGSLSAQQTLDMPIRFKYFCGEAGMTSESIRQVREIVRSKDYVLLGKKIFDKNIEMAIVAAIALNELSARNVLKLSESDSAQIANLQKLKKSFQLCYTCTRQYNGQLSELFKSKASDAYSLLRFALFEQN